MVEALFFGLGLVNSVCLIAIFLIRRWNLALLERIGWVYLLLALPAVYVIVLVQREHASGRYTIFLAIFLAFLVIEALYDWVLKLPFREAMDWRVLTPYVVLYVASTYGFVAMPWHASLAQGIVMVTLFVVQIVANVLTHPRATKTASTRP